MDYVTFKHTNAEGNEVVVSSRAQYQRFPSIGSKKPTIPPRKEKLSWVSSHQVRPGNFITPAPFYNVKRDIVQMTILEPGYTKGISGAMTISQAHTVGLGVLEDDGSGWVGKHESQGFFHAPKDYFVKWTLKILAQHKHTLRTVSIYDAIWAFKDRLDLTDREVMRAIVQCFWPATNTFVTPNGELGFSLRELKEIIGLPIVGEIYEEYFPVESEWEAETEEFRALLF